MKLHTLRISSSLLLALVGSAGAMVACADTEKEKKEAWSCNAVDVPMGEVVRCTQSALTYETPPAPTSETCTGVNDNPEICGTPTGSSGGTTSGGTTSGGTTTTPDGTASPTPETSSGGATSYECESGDPGCPDSASDNGGTLPGGETSSGGTTSGGTSGESATGPGFGRGNGNANGAGNGNGTPPWISGPDECAFVSAPYCESLGDNGGVLPGSGGGGAATCDKPNCDAPGQQKKNGEASSSSSSSGSASNGNGNGNGSSGSSSSSGQGKSKRHYVCVKDGKGKPTCTSTPTCATGTHPSACGACVPDGEVSDCVPPSAGGCWVTGGGFIIGPNVTTGAVADGHDNFGGNAKPMKDGRIQGHWNHVDHGTGNHAKGKPEYIVCRHVDEPGPGQPGGKKGFTMNQVYFGGPAEWRSNDTWASGYWFDVVAKDHGEPGSKPHVKNGGMPDTYHFTIRKMDDATHQVSGAVVYETRGELEGGNIQMHPPNPGHPGGSSALPGWVAFEP